MKYLHKEIGYLEGSTTVEFVGGFAELSTSGEAAKAEEIRRIRFIDGTYGYYIELFGFWVGVHWNARVALSNASRDDRFGND